MRHAHCRRMLHLVDILTLFGAAAMGIALVVVVRWRHRSHAGEVAKLATRMVCEHLRPALELLESRGVRITRVGQNHPDLPLEVHTAPPAGSAPFDPKAVYDELKLAEPVFVSERNVLYCKEDWCEIHPKP